MDLRRDSREFYRLAITTEPAVDAWEASFDRGTTWHAGESADGMWRWLLAGTDVAQGSAVAVIAATTVPLIRATDNPEVIVRVAPRVNAIT